MKITKKLSTFITIFVLIFGVQFVQSKKAEAFLGVGDISFDMPTLIKEFGVDTLVTILQNRILNKLVDDAVNWANGGFDGDPGFINNWDDFLQGVTHDTLSTALYTVTKQANEAQKEATKLSDEDKRECLIVANAEYQQNLDIAEKRENYYTYLNNECSDLEDDEYLECEGYAEMEFIPYHFNQINASKTASEIENLFSSAKDFCNGISGGGVYGTIGGIAEENYHSYMNSGVIDARSAAATVANYGAKKLNLDALDSLISGEGKTITFLLGSQENVDNFKTDFKFGGWQGYMALADPHNYTAGVNAMLEKTLSIRTASSSSVVDRAVQDIQTPQKYQDKRKCLEWSTPVGFDSQGTEGVDDDTINPSVVGSGSKVCIKYETVTPGALVETKMKKAMTKDEDQSYLARELSDVLARALGRLTEGLIQVGINKLSEKFKTNNADPEDSSGLNSIFANLYQNEYDVLGIADDARIFNNEESEEESENDSQNAIDTLNQYTTTIGDDASTPYVGGPEDLVGSNWNEGPELIVELKINLEKALNLTKIYVDLNTEIKKNINNLKDNVALLDYCRPGPDFGWEERYRDKAQFALGKLKNTDDKDECAELQSEMHLEYYDIGIPTTKEMNNDPAINIPGITEMTSAIISILGDKNKELMQLNNAETQEKRAMYNLLLRMSYEAKNEDYISARDLIDARIPLFTSEIFETERVEEGDTYINIRTNILSDTDIIEILNIKTEAVTNTDEEELGESYLVTVEGLYLFKEGETPADLVSRDRETAEDILLGLGWSIWRKNVQPKDKSKLRYQYHVMKNELTTEKDILELEIKLKNTKNSGDAIVGYANDCVVFLAKTKGKTDIEIKTFLEDEYTLQKSSDGSSVFMTDIYTSPANINTSILQFESKEEVNEYLEEMYPNLRNNFSSEGGYGGFPYQGGDNLARSILEILSKDQTVKTVLTKLGHGIPGSTSNNTTTSIAVGLLTGSPSTVLSGLFGGSNDTDPNNGKTLFCHVPSLGEDDDDGKNCIKGSDFYLCDSGNDKESGQRWYYGRNINYKASFVGI